MDLASDISQSKPEVSCLRDLDWDPDLSEIKEKSGFQCPKWHQDFTPAFIQDTSSQREQVRMKCLSIKPIMSFN